MGRAELAISRCAVSLSHTRAAELSGPWRECSTEPHPLHYSRAATPPREGYPGIQDSRDTLYNYIEKLTVNCK